MLHILLRHITQIYHYILMILSSFINFCILFLRFSFFTFAFHSLVVFLVFSLLICSSIVNIAFASSIEYQIKAALIYKFAKFIEWPSSSFNHDDSQFHMCILGHDPFQDDASFIENKQISSKSIKISKFENHYAINNCHIVFISSSKKENLNNIISKFQNLPVLLISDIEGFAQQGGGIEFFVESDRIRFKINKKAIERSGLIISSKLLKLSIIVSE